MICGEVFFDRLWSIVAASHHGCNHRILVKVRAARRFRCMADLTATLASIANDKQSRIDVLMPWNYSRWTGG